MSIKNVLAAKQVFKKTFKNFNKIDNLLSEIATEISSDEFKEFMKKTRKLVNVLRKSDLGNTLLDANETLK